MTMNQFYLLIPDGQSPVLDTRNGQNLKMLSLMIRTQADSTSDLTIQGLSHRVNKLTVSVWIAGQSISQDVTPEAGTGFFIAAFPGAALLGLKSVMITAVSQSKEAEDQAFVVLGDGYSIELPSAVHAVLPRSRSQFVAGVPDRIVRRSQFGLFNYLTDFLLRDQAAGNLSHGLYAFYSAQAIRRGIQQEFRKISEDAANGVIDQNEFRRRSAQTISAVAEAVQVHLIPAKDDNANNKDIHELVEIALEKRQREVAFPEKRLEALDKALRDLKRKGRASIVSGKARVPEFSGPKPVELVAIATLEPELPAYQIPSEHYQLVEQASRVGILFDDRLRIQSAGLVAGEQIYTLALSPGEEVQLRQTVETKRRLTTEDIKDREQEKTATLSSTWTNDLSEVVNGTSTQQQAMNVSGSADITIPGTPVSLGPQINLSGSGVHTESKQVSIRTNEQLTAQASARMRSQHKIRIEITDETASSFSSTRTIRNQNQQRAMTFIFHKLYRKERVTLERHNARLCLRFVVNEPGAATRAAFLSALDKLDPDNPANYSVSAPKQQEAVADIHHTRLEAYAGSDSAFAEDGFNTYFYEDLDLVKISKQDGDVNVDPAYVLADLPVVVVKSFTYKGQEYSGDTMFRYFGGHFEGNHKWKQAPPQGVTNPKGKIVATTFADEEGFWHKTLTSIADLQLSVRSKWVADAVAMTTYESTKAVERQRIIEGLTSEALYTLRDIAVRDFPNAVLAEVFSIHLQSLPRVEALNQIFNIGELIMETVPWWATERGRMNFYEILTRIEQLPIAISATELLVDALTASQVIIYLPVNEGFEEQALALLADIPDFERSRLADEVKTLRTQEFPDQTAGLEDYSVIGGPAYPPATTTDKNIWENDWEKPQRRYIIMAHWPEMVPTDGVHMETLLSDTVSTDEHREHQLEAGRIV